MVELTMNWDAMTAIEKFEWLSQHILKESQQGELGENAETAFLIQRCEKAIQESHFDRWIKNVTSEVSAHVYDGLTDAQVQHPDTLWRYYAFMHTTPAETRGRCLYFSFRELQV